jgi:hypothetical protein
MKTEKSSGVPWLGERMIQVWMYYTPVFQQIKPSALLPGLS